MILGHGWIPDAPPTEEERARHLVASQMLIGAGSREANVLSRASWVQFQRNSQGCTMFWFAAVVWGLFGFKGCAWVPYWLGRIADQPHVRPPGNVGLSVYAAMRTAEEHGIPPEGCWDPILEVAPEGGWGPGGCYEATPPAMWRIAGQKHKIDVVPVWDSGSAAVDALCSAIDHGYPFGLEAQVDERLENPTNGLVLPAQGASRGSHFLTGWGYRTASNGTKEFMSPGSWGTGYGLNGIVWISEDRIRSSKFLCIARPK